jgi:hypothetical protein
METVETVEVPAGPAIEEPKIALCMIAGNEAAIIRRCLDSAAGAFDRLCLVQAVGEATADDTLNIAWRWCVENNKGYSVDVYRNKTPGLKHIDDFAAARNKSFNLVPLYSSRVDWVLWLDCDDYLDELNCRRIREAVRTAPEDWKGIFCSYLIEKQGGVIPRERLIRVLPGRGPAGRWKNPVHETCFIDGPAGQCPQIEIFHSDHSAKHQSAATRNLTILERVLEDAPRHYFHLHTELKMLGRKPEAIAAGRAALELLGEEQVEERYIIHINLSELEPDKTVEHLMAAARLQPHRREAFAYLCQKSLIDGNLSDAISYFRLMDALPLPSPLPWTHQGIWYPYPGLTMDGGVRHAWARNYLRVRVLRASGKLDQAEKEHAEHLKEPEYAAGVEAYEAKRSNVA